nr:hypothetical protein [Tanacetum cinerariifolium]
KQVEGTARHKENNIISSHIKKIFENTRRIGARFSRVITPLFDSMMVQAAADMGDTPVETHQTPIVDQPSTSRPQKKQKHRRKQRKEAEVSHDESEDDDHVPTPSSDPLPSGEDSYTLNELMVFYTRLRRLMKIGFGRRVKSLLEKDSFGAQEDASKYGRMIEEIDQDDEIAVVADTHGRKNDDEMCLVVFSGKMMRLQYHSSDTTTGEHEQQIIEDVSTTEPVTTAGEVVTIVADKVSAALITDVTEDEISIAQALAALKSIKPKVWYKSKSIQAMMEADSLMAKMLQAREREEFSKKQKVDENVEPVINDTEELRKCMEIVHDDGDDVLIEDTPISSRSPTIIDYKIYKEGKKNCLKIIRADDENVEPVINDTEELRKCMEIVHDDGDDVLIEDTPISSRSPTIIDYKIYKEGKKNCLKIIRADVKDRFKKEKPVDDMDNLLFRIIKTMFEHHVEDSI